MKRKLLTMLIVLVLAATVIFATACNDTGMISKNNERNMTQVTATVEYAGRASEVDKLELNNTIYNFVYQYYYYYQQGYLNQQTYQSMINNIGESFTQANESLAETEAYTLYCIEYLYNKALENADATAIANLNGVSTKGKAFNIADRIKEIEAILPEKDLIKARKAYNDEIKKTFDSYRETYEKEIANSAKNLKSEENVKSVNIESEPAILTYEVGDKELNLNGLKVSVTYDDETKVDLERKDFTVTGFNSEKEAKEQEITITFGGQTATFKVDIVKAAISRPAMPTEEEDEEAKLEERFEITLANDIAAAKESGDLNEQKALKEVKRRLEKQFEDAYRTYDYYYLAKLKTQVVSTVEEIVGDINSTDKVGEKYAAKITEQKEALMLGIEEYKSKIEGTDVNNQIVHTDDGYFYVQHVLFKITDDLQKKYDDFKAENNANATDLESYLNKLIGQVGVWVSNIEYDPDATCDEEECTCTACMNYKGENPGECTDPNCACKVCHTKRFINEEFINDYGISEDKVNEDGSINVFAVIQAMYNDLGSVSETSTLEDKIEILQKFRKWIYMCNEDTGAFDAFKDGKNGYLLSNDESSYVTNFTALSRALHNGATSEDIAKWHIEGTGVGSYGWCYTEYGIHVIMLVDEVCDTTIATDIGDGYYALPLDAITNVWEYKAATDDQDEEGTLRAYIGKGLIEEAKKAAIGDFKTAFEKDKLPSKDTKIVYNKVYDDLIDSYKVK